jgi:hypothetical protein
MNGGSQLDRVRDAGALLDIEAHRCNSWQMGTRRSHSTHRSAPGAVAFCCPDCRRAIAVWDKSTKVLSFAPDPFSNQPGVAPVGTTGGLPPKLPEAFPPMFEKASDWVTFRYMLNDPLMVSVERRMAITQPAMYAQRRELLAKVALQWWSCQCGFGKHYEQHDLLTRWHEAVEAGVRRVTLW